MVHWVLLLAEAAQVHDFPLACHCVTLAEYSFFSEPNMNSFRPNLILQKYRVLLILLISIKVLDLSVITDFKP